RLVVGGHRCLSVAECLRTLLERLVGDGLVADKRLPARIVGFRVSHVRLRLHQIGARLVKRVLERPLVDRKKQVALLDQLTVLEMQLVEIARHAPANLHRIDGREATDIFIKVKNGALDRFCDRHSRWWWCTALLLSLSAARDETCKRECQGNLRGATHQEK